MYKERKKRMKLDQKFEFWTLFFNFCDFVFISIYFSLLDQKKNKRINLLHQNNTFKINLSVDNHTFILFQPLAGLFLWLCLKNYAIEGAETRKKILSA